MPLAQGSMGVALVNGQMTLVRGSRSHTKADRLLDVELYKPVAQNVFISEPYAHARIYSRDLRTVLPDAPTPSESNCKMVQLPWQSFCEFRNLSSGHSRRIDSVWGNAVSKLRVRLR